jgi:hypothetical protein
MKENALKVLFKVAKNSETQKIILLSLQFFLQISGYGGSAH